MSNLVTDAEAREMKQRSENMVADAIELLRGAKDVGAVRAVLFGLCTAYADMREEDELSERERLLAIVRGVANQEPTHVDQLFHRCSICHNVLSEPGIANNHTSDCPYRLATEYMEEVTK